MSPNLGDVYCECRNRNITYVQVNRDFRYTMKHLTQQVMQLTAHISLTYTWVVHQESSLCLYCPQDVVWPLHSRHGNSVKIALNR